MEPPAGTTAISKAAMFHSFANKRLFLWMLVARVLRTLQDVASFRHRPVAIWLWVVSVKSLKRVRCPEQAAVSNSCPVIVPLASITVFWLPPESRKCY
jgi:hypothetical protein